jgi:hypothetical protein
MLLSRWQGGAYIPWNRTPHKRPSVSDDSSSPIVGTGTSARLTTYHYLTPDQSRNLCGVLQNQSERSVAQTLPEDAAKEYGLHLCGRCADREEASE